MKLFRSFVVVALIVSLSSCTNLWQQLSGDGGRQQGVSSSLVDFLYPQGETPPPAPNNIPNLQLPLRVGVAFVPSNSSNVEGLSEAEKNRLLEQAKQSFTGRDFIDHITVIPDTYLRSRKGFQTIEQVARLYSLDVMALVSYDQVVHSDDTKSSILYWTVVGAYFVKGSKNDVQTFVDTAIFDVKTNKLLFRAPGVNKITATSTLVGSPEAMRDARSNSFSLAMADMTRNLNDELERFRERIKQDASVTVSHRQGYGGGGAVGIYSLLALALLTLSGGALRRYHLRRRQAERSSRS
ncbi:MAG: rhombotarget lipoprotein [Gammaproteobacteria bacterium]|nr:rhombotarget lipoprotein [Gammaproteobacteria bacterium]